MWQMEKNKLHIQVHNDSYVFYEKLKRAPFSHNSSFSQYYMQPCNFPDCNT